MEIMVFFITLRVLLVRFCHVLAEKHLAAMNNETLHCMEIKRLLFHSVKEVDRQRTEWERYLPVFVKTLQFTTKYTKRDYGREMEFPYGHQRFHMFGPVGPPCLTAMESYGKGDEEKRACGLKQLQVHNTVSTGGHQMDCVVYSIGSNNLWGFEEAVVAETNCRIETFDCTVGPEAKPPMAIAHRVRLHRVCLSDSDYEENGRSYKSWKSFHQITGLTTSPTFLKMDIEGFEYPVLRNIIDSGENLPLQMAIEFHYVRFNSEGIDFRRASSAELVTFIQYVYKFGGYYLIDRNDNPNCYSCTEVVLAKLNCHNHPKPADAHKLILRTNPQIQPESFKTDVEKSFQSTYHN